MKTSQGHRRSRRTSRAGGWQPIFARRRSLANARRALGVAICVGLARTTAGVAQPVLETIELHAGWNAVWLNVEPEPNDLEQLLALQASPLDCRAVWTFEPNRGLTGAGSNEPGRWFSYDKGLPASLQSLRTLRGHRAYLINVNVAGSLRLTGHPIIRPISFTGSASNAFGTLTNAGEGPLTFEEFFAHPGAAGKVVSAGSPLKHDIFSLTDAGLVRRNLTDPIAPNEAYWINVVQDFNYAGPLDITSLANGLSFGRSTAIRTLSIDLPSSPSSRTLSLQARACVALTNGDCSASEVGIEWLEFRDPASQDLPVWQPLAEGVTLDVPPGTTKVQLDLRPRRATAAAVSGVTAGGGSTILPPVVIDISDDQGARAVIAADVRVEPIFGGWAGKATLTHVSAHPSIQDIPLEQAAATPLEMTLILELPDPAGTSGAAGPRLLDALTVQTFRDGRSLQRRFSSILFDRPVDLVEDPAEPIDPFGATGTLRGTLQILPEDPLNPYRHRYNPEHRKGYEITREITIRLAPTAPSLSDELASLDGTFGPSRLAGQYTEVINGVTAQPITVRGDFRLERVGTEPGSQ